MATRKGHYELIEFLITDSVFKSHFLSQDIESSDFPNVSVAWALHVNRVDIVKLLIKNGCNPMATSHYLYGYLPGFFLAAQNLSLEAIQYCVEELNFDVNMMIPLRDDIEYTLKERHILHHCKDIKGAKGVYGTHEKFEFGQYNQLSSSSSSSSSLVSLLSCKNDIAYLWLFNI